MPLTPNRHPGGATTHAPDRAETKWIEEMVDRLRKELRRQLALIESTKPDTDDIKTAQVRATNMRSLSQIEHVLERLARMEQQRLVPCASNSKVHDDELRIEIGRKLESIALFTRQKGVREESCQR